MPVSKLKELDTPQYLVVKKVSSSRVNFHLNTVSDLFVFLCRDDDDIDI